MDIGFQVGERGSKSKAKFVPEVGKEIVVQFNPSNYEISETGRYSGDTKEERDWNTVQYLGSQTGSLNLTLYFDTAKIQTGNRITRKTVSVETKTAPIEKLAREENSLHRPPQVEFVWGKFSYKGYVKSVKTAFTLFDPSGIPIRAKVDVVMVQYEKLKERKPRESPDRTKTRVLTDDNSLWTLARKEYGDTREWRRIARANGILNPFEVETGKELKVPAITEVE